MSFLKGMLILSTGLFIILCAAGPLRFPLYFKNKAGRSIPELPVYKWNLALQPGTGRFEEKWQEGKWPMALMPVVAFENKLWIIGCKNSWSSPDGITWTAHTKTDWGERHGMSYVFYKNKLWMLAGMKTWDDFRNDVWVSHDGKNWKQIVAKASWQPRRGQHLIVFKNRLWLIGGELSSGKPDQTPDKFLDDIWSSENGIDWTKESATTPWDSKSAGQIVVFRDKLWFISTADKMIWNSSDGKNWGRMADKLPWKERQRNGLLVFNDRLWIFGGVDRNDVWFSDDGGQWQQLDEHAPWSTRSTQYSIVFNNKLWIFSGKTGREDSWSGDAWTLEKTNSSDKALPTK